MHEGNICQNKLISASLFRRVRPKVAYSAANASTEHAAVQLPLTDASRRSFEALAPMQGAGIKPQPAPHENTNTCAITDERSSPAP